MSEWDRWALTIICLTLGTLVGFFVLGSPDGEE